jgi:phosphoglycolate phosphatase
VSSWLKSEFSIRGADDLPLNNPLLRPLPQSLPELVIFDLDGTLVDSVPDLAAAIDELLTELDCPPAGIERVRLWVGNGASVLVRRALAWSGGADELGVDDVEVDSARHQTALQSFLRHYGALSGQKTALYEGVIEALERLTRSGVAMGVATNKPSQFVPDVLQHSGIGEFFHNWLGGDCLPEKKPDPAPLLKLIEQAGVSPERTLMVGDSSSDIRAARAAGVPCLAVTYGYNHGRPVEEEQPDWVCDNLDTWFAQLKS